MKEWLIENTSITDEEYERIVGCDKDYSIEDTSDEYILSHENSMLMYDITNFTLGKQYKKNEVSKIGGNYYYKGISFGILSDFYYDEFLLTPNRYGRCHIAAYSLSTNSSLDVITMICTDFQSGKDFLHSVLYTKKSDDIIDYTMNLIIDRKIYFDIMNSRVINYIPNEKMKELDLNFRNASDEVRQNVNVKELLCFPDEINNLSLKLKKC